MKQRINPYQVFQAAACCWSLLLLTLLFSACNERQANREGIQAREYRTQKISLEETEKQHPLSFLSTGGRWRKNFFGRYVIDGTITSSATVAKFKDILIEVSYYTKTKTLLGTKQFTIYEFVPPGSTISFNQKLEGLAGTEEIDWSVIQAASN